MAVFKGVSRKSKTGTLVGNLSTGPYLNVQTMDVNGAVTLQNAYAAIQNSCFLITINPVMPRH